VDSAKRQPFLRSLGEVGTPNAERQTGSGAGHGPGEGSGDDALAAYAQIIRSRFDAAWNQPRSEMSLGTKFAATVQLKIERDGTVKEFSIMQGSGNAVVDDSIREAGRKITKLPPPPTGEALAPIVRFELGD
jgi:TonB family protein